MQVMGAVHKIETRPARGEYPEPRYADTLRRYPRRGEICPLLQLRGSRYGLTLPPAQWEAGEAGRGCLKVNYVQLFAGCAVTVHAT
jgi:hypothetical protein